MKYKTGDVIYSCEYDGISVNINKLIIKQTRIEIHLTGYPVYYDFDQYDGNDIFICSDSAEQDDIEKKYYKSKKDAIQNLINAVEEKIKKLKKLEEVLEILKMLK